MANNLTFRTGKYAGKTLEWVEENAPAYLEWVRENRPEMLKVPKQPKITEIKTNRGEPVEITVVSALQPNMNFWNEGPDEQSLKYKKKVEQQTNTEDEWNF